MMSKKNKIGIILGVGIPILCLVATGVLFRLGNRGPRYEITSESIKVKGGGYGATIPVADITETIVLEQWPAIALRTNGLGTNKVGMGHFRLKNGENCMMFFHVDGGPLLEVRTVDSALYYLNCATEEETMKMIEEVKQTIDARRATGNHDTSTLYRHGGQGSAISQARRGCPSAWEIADRVRDDDKGLYFAVPCLVSKIVLS